MAPDNVKTLKSVARILLYIAGSVWFFPVSCTTGAITGLPVFAELRAWHSGEGDNPYVYFFYVMAETQEGVMPVPIKSLPAFQQKFPDARFLLSLSRGKIRNDTEYFEYSVIAQGDQEQEITVSYEGDDYFSKSVYRVQGQSVFPRRSSVTGPGDAFVVTLFACALALLIYRLSGYFYRKLST
jgi:hypothetical protein